MNASDDEIAQIDTSIHQLVQVTEKLTSELKLYKTLIRKRTKEIQCQNQSNFENVLNKLSTIQRNEQNAEVLYQKLDYLIDALQQLDTFSHIDETLSDDVLFAYIDYLQKKNQKVLILQPKSTNILINSTSDEVNTFLNARETKLFDQIVFILEINSHYSLVLLGKTFSSAYHYDLKDKKNYEYAERLVFRLRQYFNVQQITHVECYIEQVPSSAFLLENVMKIVYQDDKSPTVGDDFAMELIKLPPQYDRLLLIVTRKYFQIKFDQINEHLH